MLNKGIKIDAAEPEIFSFLNPLQFSPTLKTLRLQYPQLESESGLLLKKFSLSYISHLSNFMLHAQYTTALDCF